MDYMKKKTQEYEALKNTWQTYLKESDDVSFFQMNFLIDIYIPYLSFKYWL